MNTKPLAFLLSLNFLSLFTSGVSGDDAFNNDLQVKRLVHYSLSQANPWKNCYNESFNGKFRDELLNGEVFYSLKEAKIMIERWRFITIPKGLIRV
jgi:hypothetical protein